MSDEINVKTPFFSFGVKKSEHEIVLKQGETIIIRDWSWKKFNYIRKSVTLENGKVRVEVV